VVELPWTLDAQPEESDKASISDVRQQASDQTCQFGRPHVDKDMKCDHGSSVSVRAIAARSAQEAGDDGGADHCFPNHPRPVEKVRSLSAALTIHSPSPSTASAHECLGGLTH
jgi:hypothetical protein